MTRVLCPWRFSGQEYWSGLPCPPPGDLSDPRIEPTSLVSPALVGRFFTIVLSPGVCSNSCPLSLWWDSWMYNHFFSLARVMWKDGSVNKLTVYLREARIKEKQREMLVVLQSNYWAKIVHNDEIQQSHHMIGQQCH